MCGIAGIIDPTLSRDQGEVLLTKMLESIRYRGPDNSSQWIDMPVLLGHNRLSIIDLSDAANQPMEFDDLMIVYNGEVYNYLELRDELVKKGYRFRTNSDTEVVLAAYKEWGSDCVKRFVGMWAFAIWDKTRRELFCSRDRFGIKPFYYIHAGDKFYFGSEYKPLKFSPIFDSKLNYDQISRGLFLSIQSYRNETYFEHLKVLPERTNLIFKNGRISLSEYWDIDPSKKFRGTFEDKKRRFLELFRDSVKLHMRSDVEVGGCLSGGLDSSSIASVIGKDYSGVRYKTFTIYYKGKNQMDERNWAREVTTSFSNMEPVYFSPSANEVAACFDRVMRLNDVPIHSSSPISYYFIMKVAAQNGIKVMLDGQGSDEYLAGYSASFDRVIGGYIRKLRILSALEALRCHATRRGIGRREMGLLSLVSAVRGERQLYAAEYVDRCSSLGFCNGLEFDLRSFSGSPLKQYLYRILFTTDLPKMLHFQDRMSMSFSIESRVPFLDHRLVEFVYSLPDEDIVFQGQTKYIQRTSLEGFLPKATAERTSKQGFVGLEIIPFLRGPLSYLLESDINFDCLSMLNPTKAKNLIEGFKKGSNLQWELVWRLVSLNYWLKLN